ncbi:HDOD domain-containing protein [Variovorax soli]|uniref:EAL and modified HD-GYP domain-containing signal transduction protein n=1 Tax=Variovorax soli TaxID=376815 RepID=A0ABU1NFV7_9BURK|nr:HDOD domain-containing protein [Variovorax soli]MDR6536895.1 EAL and modified HD-GYP domain-containing signal transduction protein [Variovorax soli]
MRFDFFRRQESSGNAMPAHVPAADERDASGYVTYAQLLDAGKRVMGYRLAWHAAAPDKAADGLAQFKALMTCVGKHLNAPKTGWALGRTLLFVDVTAESIVTGELQLLPPENVVLCATLELLVNEELRPIVLFLREQGFHFMLCGAHALPQEEELRALLTHFDVGAGDRALVERLRGEPRPGLPPLQLIVTRMGEWEDFDAAAAQQLEVFVDGPRLQPGEDDAPADGALQPESMLIVQLMQMIQRNQDLREIEAVLKRDAALTYRLLRYINSPAIGAGVEIHSMRHAVTMLGYAPLFRWLSVLLAMSNAKASPPFMMKKAVLRGRFVELMGRGMLPASDADNLFVVGMFSLIDRLLGVSMQEVLGKVQLSEAVQQAILSRQGVYGPFLALAESCEEDGARAASLAEALFMSADQVNAAHLSALAWAQDLGPAGSA